MLTKIIPIILKICILFSIALLIGCSAAGEAIDKGDEALARGDNFAGVKEYIHALVLEPNHTEGLAKLSTSIQPAYEQKLKIAEGYKEQDNLESALIEYKQLRQLLVETKRYITLNFIPIDVNKAIKEVKSGAAEKHYQLAENLFKNLKYEGAIQEYKTALNFANSYKDANRKIAESFYNIALDKEQSRSYRVAANNYKKCFQQVRGYKDASKRAATIYYNLGTYFLSIGQCRTAYDDFIKAKNIIPQHIDKLVEAKKCATTKIAFVKFDNTTGQNIAGMALGDFIFEAIKTKVQSKASQFIRIFDREQLNVLAQEQRVSQGMLDSETLGSLKLEGVDYLIFGKITQVRKVRQGLSRSPKSAEYEHPVEVSYKDKKGKNKKKTEWYKATMHYTVFTDKLSAIISGSIKVVDAKTSTVVINHQISAKQEDEIKYADEFRARHDLNLVNVYYSDDIKNLAKKRKKLHDVGVLANQMVESIASEMTQKILSKLDVTPIVSDPVNLNYDHTGGQK